MIRDLNPKLIVAIPEKSSAFLTISVHPLVCVYVWFLARGPPHIAFFPYYCALRMRLARAFCDCRFSIRFSSFHHCYRVCSKKIGCILDIFIGPQGRMASVRFNCCQSEVWVGLGRERVGMFLARVGHRAAAPPPTITPISCFVFCLHDRSLVFEISFHCIGEKSAKTLRRCTGIFCVFSQLPVTM